jgi:hypothetical protein
MVSKFMHELKGLMNYLSLLQSSITFCSQSRPLRENLVVYRSVEQCYKSVPLYESRVGNVVLWPGFTSTSTDPDSVLNRFITDKNSILFEIELHPGNVAVRIEEYSKSQSEKEVLIASSTGFTVLSVTSADVWVQPGSGDPISLRIPIVGLSYFLHWYDFDLDLIARGRPRVESISI